ncbi:MAG: 1,4-alpha-glucan branching protein GlgB [Puniceicoccales bacterium]|jgi:1,4-alpha-glucan branching enzyme|nr:1,4-alpha-glucan branching protein GlgB [Puniceicoccales bacterium]
MNVKEQAEFEALLKGIHTNPHHFLGIHRQGDQWIVRGFFRDAKKCFLRDLAQNKLVEMLKVSDEGLFTTFVSGIIWYQFEVVYEDRTAYIKDPYCFKPTLTDEDLYLFNQGTHHHVYLKLGAHCILHEGVEGCAFAVWAPNAKRVSVVGDFNQWDGRHYPMRCLKYSGIWEIFIPDLQPGMKYKYEIYDANQQLQLKTDPYGLFFEEAPHNASIIVREDTFKWEDEPWLMKRAQTYGQEIPITVYEVHLGSWKHTVNERGEKRPLTYRELAENLVPYVKDLGFTHVEFLPIAEHPFLGSWGYQVTGFFAPTSRYGSPEDFMYLIDTFHKNEIGVIVDWVPGHFPKDAFALAKFDGTALYEHADPRQGEHPDWGTLIFNYGRHEVRNFLLCSALAWLERFHVDGLRVDAVASMLYLDYSRKEDAWIPNCYGGKENTEAIDFLRYVNDTVHQYYPGVLTIAEESTSSGRVSHPTNASGLGFDFKWNMGWMHDVLNYCKKDPIYRKYHHNEMSFGMLYQYSENFMMVFSHDEVVHGKGSMVNKMGSYFFDDKVSTLRALYAYMWGWPGKKTLFMGDEIGQVIEWDYCKELDWCLLRYPNHQGLQQLVKDLNVAYKRYSFWSQRDQQRSGFEWLDPDDSPNSVFSFIRRDITSNQTLLFISNFTPVERPHYHLGVPFSGTWKEILNTDANCYNGKNRGNLGTLVTQDIEQNDYPYSLNVYLPPLSTLIFSHAIS